jgi:asparagine synthase (glutamine-hydrolysing)
MCGICGEVQRAPTAQVDMARLNAMCRTITHRGPDSQGMHSDGSAALGSTRLAIIDVEGGHMPLSNEDGSVWIVFNGEIYNFAQLRNWLQSTGHRFATRTDTETIVHLYEEYGMEFARKLNGMFALAIWDARQRRLVLARDHLGVKPLFYAILPDRLVFASEIKPLLINGVSREIDSLALHDYLSLNYVPGPRTIFKAVRKLPPGHWLVYDADTHNLEIQRFWDVPLPNLDAQTQPSPNLERQLLDTMREAVHDQMVSDVPLGAFLSGGLDSSLVVALMSEMSTRPVRTFSIGFHERSYNELPFARLVAQRFKTEHHELMLEPKPHELLSMLTRHFDEPFADSSAVAVFAISKLAAQHVKVVLSGDGGDEIFGGYYTYQADKIAALYRRLPQAMGSQFLLRLAEMMPVSSRKASLNFKLKRFAAGGALPPLPAHFAWKAFMSEEMKARLYNGRHDPHSPLRPSVNVLQEYYDRYPSNDMLNRLMYVDTKVQLADDMLTKVDRASMAYSLEVRVPLLDLRLVELMARLPSSLKVRGFTLKYLMKRVAARLLPPEIVYRPKAGFNVPIAQWINADLRGEVDARLSPRAIKEQGFFNPQIVSQLIDQHRRGQSDHSRSIWNLFIFSLWYEQYIT